MPARDRQLQEELLTFQSGLEVRKHNLDSLQQAFRFYIDGDSGAARKKLEELLLSNPSDRNTKRLLEKITN